MSVNSRCIQNEVKHSTGVWKLFENSVQDTYYVHKQAFGFCFKDTNFSHLALFFNPINILRFMIVGTLAYHMFFTHIQLPTTAANSACQLNKGIKMKNNETHKHTTPFPPIGPVEVE